MKTSKYTEASALASEKLKTLPAKSNNERLYYLNKLGFAQFRMGNFDSAYQYGLQALQLTLFSQDSALISDSWQLLAYAHNRRGSFDSAIHYSNKLLGYAIRQNDHKKHGHALTSISTLLMQNKRYREALKYNFEAHSLYKKLNDSLSLATSEYNIGLAYLNLKMPDSSLIYLNKGLNISVYNSGIDLKAGILEAIAECYLLKGDKKLWKEYQLKSLEAAKGSNNRLRVAISLSQLGQQALTTGDLTTSYNYLMQAREALAKQPYPALQMRVDSMLYVTTRGQKKYAEALKWLESYSALQRQILSENQVAALNQMLVENETYKKNLVILQKELELSNVKRILSNLAIAAVFILILAGVLFVFLIRVSRYRNRLYHKNRELDRQLQIARSRFDIVSPINDEEYLPDIPDKDNLPVEDQKRRNFELYSRLLNLIEQERLYLQPELNAKTLQNRLGTNKKYLYEAIAEYSGTNFRGLINRYRIDEVRRIMEKALADEEAVIINEMVTASGFNSYTSFYRIFRQYTGLTPNEYIAQLKKEKKKYQKE
jgi:AraC-like DNA-binding protein